MLPQEMLAQKIFLTGGGVYKIYNQKEIEKYMDDLNLRYRKGNDINTLRCELRNKLQRVFNTSKRIELAAEAIDKIITFDWGKRYGKYVGGITIL